MQQVLLVALGGALGASLRYGISVWVDTNFNTNFNAGTLAVNLIGCLSIGLLMGYFVSQSLLPNKLFFLLVVGLLGGFTTFSTFAYDNYVLFESSNFITLGIYMLLSNIGGIFLAIMGYKITAQIFGA